MPARTGKTTFLVGCSRNRNRLRKSAAWQRTSARNALSSAKTSKQVVAVAGLAAGPEPVREEVIQRVEIDVGEELAGLVADGQAAAALAGAEQVGASEPAL